MTARTFLGGIHATVCLEEAIAHVNAVVTGEADGIWPKVLEDFRRGRLERRYDGGFAEITTSDRPGTTSLPRGMPSEPSRPRAGAP